MLLLGLHAQQDPAPPGQVITAARRVPGAAQAVTGDLDVGKALARRDWMTAGWDDKNQADWLAGVGATLVRGRGRLAGERCSRGR